MSQFGGSRGWGYDGVLLYAPHSAYGTPADFHAFIDAAHGLGLSVVLDIVLNHFGPEGNYLSLLSPGFFHQDRMTPGVMPSPMKTRPCVSILPMRRCSGLPNINLMGCALMLLTRLKIAPPGTC